VTPPGRWVDPFAGIPGRRLFVAVPLPADAAASVATIVEEVRAEPLPEGLRDVRWVRLDGLHLTLRFLGPTPDARIPPTVDAVKAATASVPPFRLAISGAGTFPPGPRPRTLWLGLTDGVPAMTGLAERVSTVLGAAGWPAEARPFRPHLTLARSDGLPAGPIVAERLAAAMAGRVIEALIDRIGLYESVTGGGPARYLPVVEVPFTATPPNGRSVYDGT
jgi:2'-5' RNA ligase